MAPRITVSSNRHNEPPTTPQSPTAPGCSDFKVLTDFYCETFEKKYGEKYPFQTAKDAQAAKRLLSAYGFEKAKGKIKQAFESDDPFIQKQACSLAGLASFASRLVSEKPRVFERRETYDPHIGDIVEEKRNGKWIRVVK